MKKAHGAKHHMKEAKKHASKVEHHMGMAHKMMGMIGTAKEEKKMAKKGDKKGSMYPAEKLKGK